MKRYLTPLLVTLTLLNVTACGDDSEENNLAGDGTTNTPINTATLNGTYKLSRLECNGERMSISGYQETLILSDSSGQLQMSTENCLAKETFHFEISENEVFLESDKIECTTIKEVPLYSGCHMLYYINSANIHHQCPSSFPSMFGSWQATQTTNTFTMTSDGYCFATYSKI